MPRSKTRTGGLEIVVPKKETAGDNEAAKFNGLRAVLTFVAECSGHLSFIETEHLIAIRFDEDAEGGDYLWNRDNIIRRIYLSDPGYDADSAYGRGKILSGMFNACPENERKAPGINTVIGLMADQYMVYDQLRW